MTPVVFLHGFLGAPSTWDATGVAGTRVVLPGHGATPDLSAASFTEAVDAIAAAIRQPSILAGYSMGARLALGVALLHPARVLGAVLVGANPGIESSPERDERRHLEDAQADEILARGLPAFVDSWERLPLFATQSPEQRAEERSRRLSHTAAGAAHALRALGLGRQPSLWDALGASRVPVTFLAGSLDAKFAELAARAARRAPHGVLRIVENAGHNLALEAPAAVAEAIRAHLDSSVTHERKLA